MREVIPTLLWIGNAQDGRNIRQVLAEGIRGVIDMAINELPVQFPREVTYCRFPLSDGTGNDEAILWGAISTTSILLAAEVPTLVFCSAGMSRSPAIVAAAIAMVQKIDIDAALLSVAAPGPHDVSPALWSDIKRVVASR